MFRRRPNPPQRVQAASSLAADSGKIRPWSQSRRALAPPRVKTLSGSSSGSREGFLRLFPDSPAWGYHSILSV
jgi:hypothetical protein